MRVLSRVSVLLFLFFLGLGFFDEAEDFGGIFNVAQDRLRDDLPVGVGDRENAHFPNVPEDDLENGVSVDAPTRHDARGALGTQDLSGEGFNGDQLKVCQG
jgi:hypothetical protein